MALKEEGQRSRVLARRGDKTGQTKEVEVIEQPTRLIFGDEL